MYRKTSLLGGFFTPTLTCLTPTITYHQRFRNGYPIHTYQDNEHFPNPHLYNPSVPAAVMCRLLAPPPRPIPCEGLIHNLSCGHRVRSSSPACRRNCASPGFGAKNRGVFRCRGCKDLLDRKKVWNYQREIQDLWDFILTARLQSGACAREIEAAEDKIDIIEMQMRQVAGWEAVGPFLAQCESIIQSNRDRDMASWWNYESQIPRANHPSHRCFAH